MSGPVLMKLRLPSGFVADLDITSLLVYIAMHTFNYEREAFTKNIFSPAVW